MSIKTSIVFILCLVWSLEGICQSTTVGIKIGNNGNISFNNNFKSGNYKEMYHFGNGYQGGVSISQRLFNGLRIRSELTYVNSNFAIDHESKWSGTGSIPGYGFYEELQINSSAFNLNGNLVLKIGRVKLGAGGEVSLITQAGGRGLRFNYEDPKFIGRPHAVQYRFFANRRQVYNSENPDEKFAYVANRIVYGLDFNANILVYKPISVQAKVFYPLNGFIREFTGFENVTYHQKTMNIQLSVVYEMPILDQVKFRKQSKKKVR